MDSPLDEQYLTWLYSKVNNPRTRARVKTHWNLFKQLYSKEFVWFVPNDDNRIQDGRDLRYEFVDDLELTQVDQDWMELNCSIFELLIALSRLIAFEAGGSPRVWFWELMRNLELDELNDAVYNIGHYEEAVNEKLDRLIWRTYAYDGSSGGLFPLKHPSEDQRDVELWYQLCAYVLER